jgi:ABC-2 type transport system permease protein
MKTLWDVFKTSLKNNFVREFIYRSNTIALTVADLIWVFVELAFFEVIYSNTQAINGWTRDQVFFFLGIFVCSDTLFTTFFQRSFWNLPYMINQGDLDILLTKPINTVFLATFRDINFSQIINLAIGIYIVNHYGPAAGFTGGLGWFVLLLWIFIGLATQYLVRFFFVIWVFWLERGLSVSHLYYQLYALANKPEAIYPKAIRYLLKTALPFAFMGSVPSQVLIGKGSFLTYVLVIAVLTAYAFLIRFLWKSGLKRYQSASS